MVSTKAHALRGHPINKTALSLVNSGSEQMAVIIYVTTEYIKRRNVQRLK